MAEITRKEFLTEVMKVAELGSLREADKATRAVVSILKREIGVELTDAITNVLSPDLRDGWEKVTIVRSELEEMMK